MDDPGIARLKEHFSAHNRWVALLTVLTALISAVLWVAIYFIACWLFILAGSIARPVDFQPKSGAILRYFAIASAALLALAWIVRRLRPNAAPRDRKRFLEHILDVLLALPRLTLSIFGTGGATARLSPAELEQALHLLRRMDDTKKHIHVQTLPVDIPDETTRDRILLALQLSGVIDIRASNEGPVLYFHNQEIRHLAQDRVRLRV